MQLFEGIENRQLAQFTVLLSSLLQAKKQQGKDQTFSFNELTDHASKLVTFSDDRSVDFSNLKISNTNRDQLLSRAEQDAVAYAEARNRNSQPANLTGFDQSVVQQVKDWVASRGKRMRGAKPINND